MNSIKYVLLIIFFWQHGSAIQFKEIIYFLLPPLTFPWAGREGAPKRSGNDPKSDPENDPKRDPENEPKSVSKSDPKSDQENDQKSDQENDPKSDPKSDPESGN